MELLLRVLLLWVIFYVAWSWFKKHPFFSKRVWFWLTRVYDESCGAPTVSIADLLGDSWDLSLQWNLVYIPRWETGTMDQPRDQGQLPPPDQRKRDWMEFRPPSLGCLKNWRQTGCSFQALGEYHYEHIQTLVFSKAPSSPGPAVPFCLLMISL